MTDDHYATVYLFNKEECLWSFARTSALNHARLPTSVRESITTAARIRRKRKKKRESRKREEEGGKQQWEAHLMWSVCKQIAIFYVNLNLSCSASYQACWQRGAYLSCWQDERGDREGEREKTCQRWLITSQANSWVLCLHLDSRVRLRWASLIRIFFHFFHRTCAPWIISSHQLCLGFEAEDSLNYQRACSDESQ